MSNTSLASAAVPVNATTPAAPAKLPTAGHAAAMTMQVDRTRVPAEGGCAPTAALVRVGVDSNFIPGNPSWSPPV